MQDVDQCLKDSIYMAKEALKLSLKVILSPYTHTHTLVKHVKNPMLPIHYRIHCRNCRKLMSKPIRKRIPLIPVVFGVVSNIYTLTSFSLFLTGALSEVWVL